MVQIGIIDDDRSLVNRLAEFIDLQEGYACCLQAYSLGEFFEKVSIKEEPDILLLDIDLEGNNSLDHISKIKRILPHTKVIILTGLSNKEYFLKALSNGANSFFLKGKIINVSQTCKCSLQQIFTKTYMF